MNFPQFDQLIHSCDEFILTCHETPDGDAIGSEIALYHGLKQLGKNVRIINNDPAPDKYSFLYNKETIEIASDLKSIDPSGAVVIILDTNDINNTGLVGREILPRASGYFIIDHHESGTDIATGKLIEVDASSTCEILFRLISDLDIDLTEIMAQALYTGIIYDTGCFVYPKTTAYTFQAARKLVEAGAKPYDMYSAIYESNSVSSLKLQSKVLATLELFYNQQVAVQVMEKNVLQETGAQYEEADSLINIPLRSGRIKVSLFFKENQEGLLRCSLRSKGNINVAAIAQKYGGGGHRTAAGFKSPSPLAQIKEMVLTDLSEYFDTL